MLISNDFLKALKGLLIACAVIAIYTIVLEFTDLRGSDRIVPTVYLVLYNIQFLITSVVFWLAVAYVTKEKKAATVAFLIEVIWLSIDIYIIESSSNYEDLPTSRYWIGLLSSLLAYTVFGLMYFRKIRGVFFGIASFIVIIGIQHVGSVYEVYGLLDFVVDFFGYNNVFEVKKYVSETSYTEINLFVPFIDQIYTPLRLIIFWYFLLQFSKKKGIDFSLRTIDSSYEISPITFSIFYWILRIALLASVFGIMGRLSITMEYHGQIRGIFNMILYTIAIFVVASIYRNVVTAYYISRGRYPSWSYLLLGIPIVNFFTWLFLIFRSPKSVFDETAEEDQGDYIVAEKGIAWQLQKLFVQKDKNIGIKVLFILALSVTLFRQIIQINNMTYLTGNEFSVLLGLFLFSGAVLIWYIVRKEAMLILYPIYAVIIYLLVDQEYHYGMIFIAVSLINLIVYYSIFHFDNLKFEKEDNQEIVDENSESDF